MSARARALLALRETAFFALFAALSVAFTWPVARRMDSAVADQADPLLNAWILDWVSYALTHAPLDLFSAPMYHPALFSLAFSENLIGIALFVIPFHLAGLDAVSLYNVAQILGFAHAGYGAFVLARMVSRSTLAGILAGVFFAFTQFKLDHLSHLQVLWSGWLPPLLAAFIAYWEKPTRRRAGAFFGVFVMNGLTNIHWLLFGSFATAVTMALFAVLYPRRGRDFWRPLLVALLLGSLVLIPVLVPYAVVSRKYDMHRTLSEVEDASPVWTDWLLSNPRNVLYGRIQDPTAPRGERLLFPGLLALFLMASVLLMTPGAGLGPRASGLGGTDDVAVPSSERYLRAIDISIIILAVFVWAAMVSEQLEVTRNGVTLLTVTRSSIPMTLAVVLIFVRFSIRLPAMFGGSNGKSLRGILDRSRFSPALWAGLFWIGVGMLGAFGTNAFLHPFLFRLVAPFRAVRAPGRWAILTLTGLVVFIAIGVVLLLAARKGWRRHAVAVALCVAAALDVWPNIRWDYAVTAVPPVYRWLATAPEAGPILQIPMVTNSIHYQLLLHQTHHRVPMLNGTSGFEPEFHQILRAKIGDEQLDEEFWRIIEETGCRTIIVSADILRESRKPVLDWLQREVAAGRLAFLRRFDRSFAGDYVFAIPANFPGWQRFRDSRADAIGHWPAENLRRLFAGEFVYSDSTIAKLEVPAPHHEYNRELHISGWALSPHGIRRATILLAGGKMRFDTQEFGRPDVQALLPWYPKTKDPGFVVEMKKRPAGIPPQTTVEVEIEDGAGRITRLPAVHFTWH